MLAAEFESGEASRAQRPPQFLLLIRLLAAQATGVLRRIHGVQDRNVFWKNKRLLTARTGDIADTLNQRHHLHFAWFGAAVVIDRWAHAAHVLLMQFAQQYMVEVDAPHPAALAAQPKYVSAMSPVR